MGISEAEKGLAFNVQASAVTMSNLTRSFIISYPLVQSFHPYKRYPQDVNINCQTAFP
jgi:hypothetical protein